MPSKLVIELSLKVVWGHQWEKGLNQGGTLALFVM